MLADDQRVKPAIIEPYRPNGVPAVWQADGYHLHEGFRERDASGVNPVSLYDIPFVVAVALRPPEIHFLCVLTHGHTHIIRHKSEQE